MKKQATRSTRATPRKKPEPDGAEAPRSRLEQSEWFAQAITEFREGRLSQARDLFEKAAAGPVKEMAHAARTHLLVCERRLNRDAPAPASAEDHYNLGVALINRRDLERAERHLREALKLEPASDHILYALALAQGLRGDIYGAGESLTATPAPQP